MKSERVHRPRGRLGLAGLCLGWILVMHCLPVWGAGTENASQPLVLRALTVEGAETLSKSWVKEGLSLELPSRWPWKKPPVFKPEELASDLERLQLYYRKEGFYHAQIKAETHIQDTQVRVVIRIQEGPWVKVTAIKVGGADIPLAILQKIEQTRPLKPGDRFTETNYEGLKQVYLNYFRDHGHPHANIQGKVLLDETANTADIVLTFQPGARCTFGEVMLKGDLKTPEYIIRRKLTFAPGDLYSQQKVYESQRRLYALDLFQSVSLTPLETPQEEQCIPWTLEIQERKQRSLKVGLGYGSEDHFRARLGLRWRNLGGGARILDLDAKYSFLESRLAGSLISPQILTSYLDLVLQTGLSEYNYPSFRDKAFFTQARLERELPRKWRLAVGHALEFDRPFNIPLETLILLRNTEAGETYRASMALLRLSRDTTNDPADPSRGGIISLSGEVAPTFFGSSLQFARAVAEARHYHFLGPSRVIMAGRVKFGIIEPIQKTEEIPIFRRFFTGGANTVRGYRLDYLGPRAPDGTPLGGTALMEGSLEARIPLYKEFRAVAFMDFGNVYLKPRDFDLGQLKYASGFGLRYQTPVGPVGLDVGFPLNPIDPQKDTYRIYFTIGQAF